MLERPAALPTPDGHRGGSDAVQLYDLSDTISNATSDFELNKHSIEYVDASTTAGQTGALYGLGSEAWPDRSAWNVENVTLSTHSGTHVDSPHHYGPRAEGGRAMTIDEVPLEWCYGNGVLLDFRHKAPGDGITADDVGGELARIGHSLQPLDIVLVMTGASRRFRESGYQNLHAGLRRDATEYLLDRDIRLIGIDAWGFDRPFDAMVAEFRAGDREQLWESHILGRTREYCQIEKLANLESLPAATGFKVAAFPVKIEAASGAWCRVVAIFGAASESGTAATP
jgi:kynurenine formamidase